MGVGLGEGKGWEGWKWGVEWVRTRQGSRAESE